MGDPLFGSHWPVTSSGSFRQDIIAKEENGMNFQEDFEFRQECMCAFSSEFMSITFKLLAKASIGTWRIYKNFF